MHIFPYNFAKNVLFKLDAEIAHELVIKSLHQFPRFLSLPFRQSRGDDQRYCVESNAGKWNFPVGLAAGLDKNAECIDFFSSLFFGAIEVGTVTPKPQPGNSKPRLFRIPDELSLRNKMGFNNLGAHAVLNNILQSQKICKQRGKILGVNLGKNKVTPEDRAVEDYRYLYQIFCEVADYLVINVSSPNTPGLRNFESAKGMGIILQTLADLRKNRNCPLYVKISPNLPLDSIPEIIELVKYHELAGIVATNTTIMPERGDGGVSGKLLYPQARATRMKILECLKETPEIDLIGVGGFASFEDIWDYWQAGGRLLQIYTAFIYQGPKLLNDIKNKIDQKLDETGCKNLSQLLSR